MSIPPPNFPPPGDGADAGAGDASSERPGPPVPPVPTPPAGTGFPPPPTGPVAPTPLPPRRPGRLAGAAIAVAFWAASTLLWLRFGGHQAFTGLFLTLGASILAATVAVASERLRPYAAGFLIASGILPIVLGGACIGFVAILTAGH